MGYTRIEIKMPTDFTEEELRRNIAKKLRIQVVSYSIEKKSLDARKKNNIHWLLNVCVTSPELKGAELEPEEVLSIPYRKRDQRIIVVGSGPAGFFAAYTLQMAGFNVVIIEQGGDVDSRATHIRDFEQTGELNEKSNYSFGEGGAGTFSDGKLTSRTKSISLEKKFIFDTYIANGAPEEIGYLAHPHLGSDNLALIVKNLRKSFMEKGGTVLFNTTFEEIKIQNGRVQSIGTNKGTMEADVVILATGHSSVRTYRMLIHSGVLFRVKPFAIGCRVEHLQSLINSAQWGVEQLSGVFAAEYRLTYKADGYLPVYSFCMCPGGKVVPATPYRNLNIVNGMSQYMRNLPYANAAIVAAVHPADFLGNDADPLATLTWLEELEERFFKHNHSYDAPACRISDFIRKRISESFESSSYPFKLVAGDFDQLLPGTVSDALRAGLKDFSKKLKGFDTGVMVGLESKTSSPIQAIRDETGKSAGIENLYICGEGSGYAGGIVSSAADGIKTALSLINIR